MELVLGLDVGTRATKGLLVDLQGNVVAGASYDYGLITPREGWVEQNPEELWRGVIETSRTLLREVDWAGQVVAISLAAQGGTTIPVDAHGCPSYNAISWMDQRGEEHAQYVDSELGKQFVYRTTGWRLRNSLPLQHIGWLRTRRPEVFASTRHFHFVNDFIIRRLTGQLCMDPSDASITQLFNIARGDWDEELLSTARVRRDQLSPVYPSGHVVGTVTKQASKATGLSDNVLVINGAHDQYCAAVSTGVTHPGPMLLSCGTAWVILAVPESLDVGLRSGLLISCHAVEGCWGAMHSLGGVGTSLEWLLDNVWRGSGAKGDRQRLYGAINARASRSPPGAKGLMFFTLAGGHGGSFGPGRGGFLRLSLSHSRGDMARAVMEGIGFEVRWAVEEAARSGIHAAQLRMVGGASASSVWPQIVADVTDVPVVLPAVKQAASLGAAILAGVGAGCFADPEAGYFAFAGEPDRLEPRIKNHGLYDEAFYTYRRLSELLAGS